jgi:hypothetical protein
MQNNLSADMYSDGTATSGKQIGGLQLLVADTPTTGTVGGINRAPTPSGATRSSRPPTRRRLGGLGHQHPALHEHAAYLLCCAATTSRT